MKHIKNGGYDVVIQLRTIEGVKRLIHCLFTKALELDDDLVQHVGENSSIFHVSNEYRVVVETKVGIVCLFVF
ncbi:hypothetical protein [Flagellimonas marinaquae]